MSAVQQRRKSQAFPSDSRSSNVALYLFDCVLSAFVLPFLGSAFWVSVDYVYLYRTADVGVAACMLSSCAVLYVSLHVASKSIYRLVVKHARHSKVRFHVAAKTYVYVSSVAGVVVFDGVEIFIYDQEWAQDVRLNILMVVFCFVALFSMKCFVHLAAFGDDVGHESTPEEVFLFPFRIFEYSVLFTELVANRFVYLFSSRLYTEIFGIASVSSWFGIWTAFDAIAGANTRVTVVVVVLSYVGLFCTKTVRNITASPFAIITDRKRGYFDVPTLFQWSFHWKKSKVLYLLDSIFSVFIVGSLVILVWRGAWCILDRLVFPSDTIQSAWASLAIGYALVIMIFVSQPLMKKLMRKYDGWKRLSALDTYIVVSFWGTINVWRGIWMLLENYIDLENSLWKCLALHFGSFFILVAFNASNTLLVRGVYIDADECGDECVEFPCYYFRLRFQTAKLKEMALGELDGLNSMAEPVVVAEDEATEDRRCSRENVDGEWVERRSDADQKSNNSAPLMESSDDVDGQTTRHGDTMRSELPRMS